MDPSKAKLIDIYGTEVEHDLSAHLSPGQGSPRVLVVMGKRSGAPSTIYVADDTEIAKRNWTEMVYREQSAMFI